MTLPFWKGFAFCRNKFPTDPFLTNPCWLIFFTTSQFSKGQRHILWHSPGKTTMEESQQSPVSRNKLYIILPMVWVAILLIGLTLKSLN
jgi:hypothetical protein